MKESMKIVVKASTIVQAASDTPQYPLWSSNMDLVMPNVYATTVFLYSNCTGSAKFFDANVLKDSLSRALVLFYPMAGRLGWDRNGRLEIKCNNAGVLFVEAESDGVLTDFGEYTTSVQLNNRLVPVVDYSQGLSSYPVTVLQVTYFKCGGVSVGFGAEHHVADGTSLSHFVNAWSEIVRGLDPTIIPIFDRTLLRARDPPKPTFHHIEYQAYTFPKKITPCTETIPNDVDVSTFKLTRDQINSLKALSNHTTFDILAGHFWRSVCRARDLPNDQETKVEMVTSGRARLRPPLPRGYFGNVLFTATSIGLAGDLVSNPTQYAASKIHNALARMDNDYLRSAVDYLEREAVMNNLFTGPIVEYPDLEIISWAGLGINNMDFGWGVPIFYGPSEISYNGQCYVIPCPTNDGSFFVAISLQKEHMKSFREYVYEIGVSSKL